eukprot:TRINITY_DN12405_c0_g1_i1.p1 TRINITY_DN12405_c0_g1~~TRINITY_DN12405_c0_g1_i1.p1  ORF type:complete len:248 (-),score=99.36 TRINITY_DN12405_c0_g1_i1:61-804(-)
MLSDEDDFFSSDEEDVGVVPSSVGGHAEPPRVKGKKHLEEMKDLFGLKELKTKTILKREKRKRRKERQKLLKNKEGIIETLAVRSSGKFTTPEVHVFVDPQKKNKTPNEGTPKRSSDEPSGRPEPESTSPAVTSMKEARFDVFKFGLSGFDKARKEDAEEALAIRLGAKPRKNKCLPYEEFKKVRKAEKEEMKAKQALKDSFAKKKPKKTESKAGKSHTEKIHTKIGKFDGGMLKISAAEVKKMKAR